MFIRQKSSGAKKIQIIPEKKKKTEKSRNVFLCQI